MKKFLSGILIGIIGLFSLRAYADYTLQDVFDLPVMYLNEGITTTQTTGITIAQPNWNGDGLIIPAMSGAIFEFRNRSARESIYAEAVHVNQTTGVITLGGTVIRDVCYNIALAISSCNDGQKFDKSAEVRMSNSNRLYNSKANINRANTFTAIQTFNSGATISGTRFALRVSQVTTSQRDAIPSPQNGMIVYNSSTGLLNQYISGAWDAIGNSATPNAGWNVTGKLQVATIDQLIGRRSTGSTLSLLSINPTHLTMLGGTQFKGFLTQVGTGGYLAVGVGGTGSGSYAANGILTTSGSNAFRTIRPNPGTNTGAVAKFSGRSWGFGSVPGCDLVYNAINDSSTIGTSTLLEEDFSKNYRINSGSYVAGDVWKVESMINNFGGAGATGTMRMKLGTTTLAFYVDATGVSGMFEGGFVVRSLGSSGTIMPFFSMPDSGGGNRTNAAAATAQSKGINTASGYTIKLSFQPDSSNGGFSMRTRTFSVYRCSSTTSN